MRISIAPAVPSRPLTPPRPLQMGKRPPWRPLQIFENWERQETSPRSPQDPESRGGEDSRPLGGGGRVPV